MTDPTTRALLIAGMPTHDELLALLPGAYYMDPPDGGSVTVLEQLQRMALDAARYRWLRACQLDDPEIYIAVDSAAVPGRWALGGNDPEGCDTAIDAAMKA